MIHSIYLLIPIIYVYYKERPKSIIPTDHYRIVVSTDSVTFLLLTCKTVLKINYLFLQYK